ncbi:hypothetical protein [Bacillus sp. FJAT-45037]|uniref:hypothetical protein n=1 Tax=Bacillus sp. FJAT-45037 TaxID=2011007 RepID=UPI000C23D905|nr:hypothetical protein [Bacillus sp. FJAT-45037]
MQPTEWTLHNNNQQIKLLAHKITIFQQCKVVECSGANNLRYSLFFYKNKFLTIQPLVTGDRSSFLGLLKQKGHCINAPSPIISLLLSDSSSVKIDSINQLLSKITKQYSLLDSSLILSYFDSYIPQEQLNTRLKEAFFSYRRDGKLLGAFRLAKLLLTRGYKDTWVTSAIKHADYSDSKAHFQAPLSKLLETEPLYAEQQSFSHNYYETLLTLYQQQNRIIDPLIIYVKKFREDPTPSACEELIKGLTTHLSAKEALLIQQSLLSHVPPTSGLHQHVYQQLMNDHNYNGAADVLFNYSFSLSEKEAAKLLELFTHVSLSKISPSLQAISERLLPFAHQSPQTFEHIIKATLPDLLDRYSLADIHTHFQESSEVDQLPIISKIQEMVHLMDDTDNQLTLGKLYFDFQQYEKAIECFSWEMELRPQQTEPIQWLVKTYQKMGKLEEVESYNNLLIQMKQSS